MSISIDSRYHATVITVSGRFLGSMGGRDFKNQIDQLNEDGHLRVVLDLGKPTFMDSTAIGALIGGAASLRKEGGRGCGSESYDSVTVLVLRTRSGASDESRSTATGRLINDADRGDR